MKQIYLLLSLIIISACSTDEIGPMGLKHGEEVAVFIDHRYGAINDHPLLLPTREIAEYSVRGFDGREPGYSYTIKARAHIGKNDPPIQDASAYWLDFLEIIEKERYEGDASFQIPLIQATVPGGPMIVLIKENGQYYLQGGNLRLKPENAAVIQKLALIWEHREEIRESYLPNQTEITPKWIFIRATVTHDPEDFGKSYLVSQIELTEK